MYKTIQDLNKNLENDFFKINPFPSNDRLNLCHGRTFNFKLITGCVYQDLENRKAPDCSTIVYLIIFKN